MAWTETCKIEFKFFADHFYDIQKGRKNLTKVLRKLSKDSGIPFKTLKRWYYEKEKEGDENLNGLKNEPTPEPTENKEENEINTVCTAKKICVRCKKIPVEINARTKKPLPETSKYYGLCQTCRRKAKIMNDAIALANEEESGEWVICPECQNHFLIPNKEV